MRKDAEEMLPVIDYTIAAKTARESSLRRQSEQQFLTRPGNAAGGGFLFKNVQLPKVQ